jgi:MFS family permease
VVALLGTGLATVALGLLAYDLAGEQAGLVLGAIFTIKMIAYVIVAPIAAAFVNRFPRRTLLVSLDIVRAVIALMLPFVNEIWQVYVLIFVLQSASAAFTPAFQATIPDVLPDEGRYTRALSLSRLAYDLENIVSPILAALLLVVVSSNVLLFLDTRRLFGFCSPGSLGDTAQPAAFCKTRNLRANYARYPHLFQDTTSQRTLGIEPRRCGSRCHGYREYGRADTR